MYFIKLCTHSLTSVTFCPSSRVADFCMICLRTMFIFHFTAPTVELKVTEKSDDPLRLNGSISVQCKWPKEYSDETTTTNITFWWKDVRTDNFVQVCQVRYEEPGDAKNCSSIESYPEFEEGDNINLTVKNIRYKSAVKCSVHISGEPAYSSAEIPVRLTGKYYVIII